MRAVVGTSATRSSSWATNHRTTLRIIVRVPLVGAPPRYAVSRICNPRGVVSSKRFRAARRLAECNSAIQQIANLRYKAQRPPALNRDGSWGEQEKSSRPAGLVLFG